MARYLLDTNIVSYLVDRRASAHGRVRDRLAELADGDDVAVSILSLFELEHWLAVNDQHRPSVDGFLAEFTVEPLSRDGAMAFGELVRALRARHGGASMKRAVIDCMIAATAIVADRVLVSNDAVFVTLGVADGRLRLDNWAAA